MLIMIEKSFILFMSRVFDRGRSVLQESKLELRMEHIQLILRAFGLSWCVFNCYSFSPIIPSTKKIKILNILEDLFIVDCGGERIKQKRKKKINFWSFFSQMTVTFMHFIRKKVPYDLVNTYMNFMPGYDNKIMLLKI